MKRYLTLVTAICISSISFARPQTGVVSLAAAMDSLARVSVSIGGDTETQWAADTVHFMHKDMLLDKNNPAKQMARTHVMQSYIAYGINYFIGTICLYHDPDLAGWTLNGAIPETNRLYAELDSLNFADEKKMLDLSMTSLQNMSMYLLMDGAINRSDRYRSAGYPLWAADMCDSLYNTMSDKHEAIKLCHQLESTAFFMVYSCMINRFTSSKEEHDANMEITVPIATYFDRHSKPIHVALSGNVPLPKLSESEYQEFLQTSLEYRVKMIELLTKQWIKAAKAANND